tara:strand:- start:320 stop:751 length:432 start_codon:yes stop_codon:yes gene_type:complete
MKSFLFVLATLALLAAGCSPLRPVVSQLNYVAPFADVALEALEAQYEKDLRAADDIEKVRKCYEPAFEAHRAFVASFNSAKAALALAASLENAGAVADVEISSAIKAVTEAIKAFDAFKRLSQGDMSCGSSKLLGESFAGQPA